MVNTLKTWTVDKMTHRIKLQLMVHTLKTWAGYNSLDSIVSQQDRAQAGLGKY